MAFKLECGVESCNFEAINDDKDIMLALYASHQKNHEIVRAPPTNRAETSRAAKAERPKISAGSSEESWNTVLTRWNNYKRTAAIPDSLAAGELFECCDADLGDDIIRLNSSLLEGPEAPLLEAIKKLAVIPTAACVRRKEVLQLKQDHSETVRSFFAKVKGKADTCGYTVPCPDCNTKVDYTSHQIKDVLLVGLSDLDIQRDVLGWPGLDDKTVSETVTFIESKEMARNALRGDSLTGAINSAYRKLQKKQDQPDASKDKQMGKCPVCGKDYHLYVYSKYSKRWNEQPFATCFSCKPPRKKANKVESKPKDDEAGALFATLGAVVDRHISSVSYMSHQFDKKEGRVILRNKIFDNELGWQTARRQHHPRLRLRVTTLEADYKFFEIPYPKIAPTYVDVVTDSGAMSCLWGYKPFIRSGFKDTDLIRVDHGMCAANKVPIRIIGAIILRLSGESVSGEKYECAVMVFISAETDDFFLSKEAMQQLAIIPKDFPRIGAANACPTPKTSLTCVSEPTTMYLSESDSSLVRPSPVDDDITSSVKPDTEDQLVPAQTHITIEPANTVNAPAHNLTLQRWARENKPLPLPP